MKIAIAGYGLEGEQNYRYWATQGNEVVIVDERHVPTKPLPEGAQTLLGEGVFGQLQDFDMVIRTAGLNPDKIQTNGKVWSATNEFFAKCPAPIIGVTGTKGKGTTCSLIAEILRADGKTVHLLGNIGVPALSELDKISPQDIVVYELSSFQLWDMERSPHVAVIVYMEPDHQEVHASMDEYVRAKANIRIHQKLEDICYFCPDNQYTRQIVDMPADHEQNSFESRDWHWRAFTYGVPNTRDKTVPTAYLDRDVICIQRADKEELSTVHTNIMKIPGSFNHMNACAAISAALMFNPSDESIKSGLSSFTGLPHRLKFVREVGGVMYYDDSIATTPGSAIGAMRAFKQPKIMILGGSSKGANFEEVARVAQDSSVKCAVVIGDEADNIERLLAERNILTFNLGSDVTMSEVVNVASGRAGAGDVVILSPACASFGMFKNYADSGEQYIAAVEQL